MARAKKPGNQHPPALTLVNLRIFECVARHSNFSRAAEELAVSQPYASTQIAELEQRLGLVLFRRVGRRLYLTDAGTRLHGHAKSLLSQLAIAEARMAELRERVLGRLECATVVIPAQHLLPPFLEQLAETHPGLQVVLHVSGSREVEAMVLDGRVEVGLTLSRTIPDGLDGVEVGRDELVIALGPSHRLAAKATIAPLALAAETLIVREPASGTRVFVETVFAGLGLPLRYGTELNNNEVIKSLVATGVGAAVLSRRAVAEDVRANRLRALTLEGVDLSRPIRVVVKRGQPLTALAETFRRLLLAFCGVDGMAMADAATLPSEPTPAGRTEV